MQVLTVKWFMWNSYYMWNSLMSSTLHYFCLTVRRLDCHNSHLCMAPTTAECLTASTTAITTTSLLILLLLIIIWVIIIIITFVCRECFRGVDFKVMLFATLRSLWSWYLWSSYVMQQYLHIVYKFDQYIHVESVQSSEEAEHRRYLLYSRLCLLL